MDQLFHVIQLIQRIRFTLLATGLGLSMVGCGQTGALRLPSDPNVDSRAHYLLYPAQRLPSSQGQVYNHDQQSHMRASPEQDNQHRLNNGN